MVRTGKRLLRKNRRPKGARLRWKVVRLEPGLMTVEFVDVFPFDKIYYGCELWRITRRMYVFKTGKTIFQIFWSLPIHRNNIERGWFNNYNLKAASLNAFSNFCEEREERERERENESLS